MNIRNKDTNKNLKRLCRMARAWKGNCNVSMSGILIDTLAYKFINDWEYKDKSYLYYDFMSRDFSSILKNWMKIRVIGLHQEVNVMYGKRRVSYKSKTAYNNAVSAISYENSNCSYSAKQKWREIYGTKFPE